MAYIKKKYTAIVMKKEKYIEIRRNKFNQNKWEKFEEHTITKQDRWRYHLQFQNSYNQPKYDLNIIIYIAFEHAKCPLIVRI